MLAERGIFWLSSFPKSGNTWFRIVLANLLKSANEPTDLNTLNTGFIASSRSLVDEELGFDSANLNHDEIDQLRPLIYKWHSKQLSKIAYYKIHDAYTILDDGMPMIPVEGSLGVLYFIRNPLDVAISFANHSVCSIDQAIESMSNKKFAFCKGRHKQYNQLRQRLLSWSMHVQSWVTAPEMNVCVVRYEDMKYNPVTTFTKAFEFLQIQSSQENIERALDNASIEKLQQQEMQFGFKEKPAKVKQFFRKGIVGDWQTTLTPAQVDRIIQDHGEVMEKYGYIPLVPETMGF